MDESYTSEPCNVGCALRLFIVGPLPAGCRRAALYKRSGLFSGGVVPTAQVAIAKTTPVPSARERPRCTHRPCDATRIPLLQRPSSMLTALGSSLGAMQYAGLLPDRH